METVTQNSIKQGDFSTLSASEMALIVANNELLEKQNADLKNQQAALENKQQELLQKIHWFEEQFKLLRHQKFASSSEKLSHLADIQAQLFDEGAEMLEAEGDGDEDQAQQKAEEGQQAETEEITYTRLKPKRKNRNIDTSQLPREKRYLDLSEEEKRCSCGCGLEQIGEEIKEVIEYQPATLKVIEYIRFKYTCRQCETIKTAPVIELPIPKSKASASLLTEIIINKYRFHLPLYRQSKMLKQYSLEVPDNTC